MQNDMDFSEVDALRSTIDKKVISEADKENILKRLDNIQNEQKRIINTLNQLAMEIDDLKK